MNAHRAGGSIIFRNDAGEFIGAVPMSTIPMLIACGERVPVQGIDESVGHVARVKDQVVVTLHSQRYHAPWHEFRKVGMMIGTSVSLTDPGTEVNSSAPDRVTRSDTKTTTVQTNKLNFEVDAVTASNPKSATVLVSTPGQSKEYVVIPLKKLKPRPTPPPSCVRQSYQKLPVGGV
ncbi:MAG: hypothetical protein GX268_07255 [Methanomicrobiales archaeon]|jgi:hypothetical protein|nr:hypothetical protein [Methanomicrobiales archaeon]